MPTATVHLVENVPDLAQKERKRQPGLETAPVVLQRGPNHTPTHRCCLLVGSLILDQRYRMESNTHVIK